MEDLSKRLGALQEKMMELYETGSASLRTQVIYWLLMRKEQALLYHARQCGANRLGMCAVPPLQVSKARASKAIKMHLVLTSLEGSKYGLLPWTMRETSYERYKANPKNTLKKEGVPVQVLYDGEKAKGVEYVLWTSVFAQGSCGKWTCFQGGVDSSGLYVDKEGRKQYYEDFQKDSLKYGVKGVWTVVFGNETLYSSASPQPCEQPFPAVVDTTDEVPPFCSPSPEKAEEQALPSKPKGSSGSSPRFGKQGKRGSSKRKLSEEGEQQGQQQQQQLKKPYCEQPASEHCNNWTKGRQQEQQEQQQQQQQQQQQRQHNANSDRHVQWSGVNSPINVDDEQEEGQEEQQQQQQQQQQQVQQQPSTRNCDASGPRVSQESSSPRPPAPLPVVVLSGNSNQVKCLRYRLYKKFKHSVLDISSTWCWTSPGCPTAAKITVIFASSSQREDFLSKVTLPKGVTFALGELPY
ncbi:E2 [Ailuropoda melanoleuca papillomavirus 1]|uniref:Regulatory protein E2 n=1 Tax=Ailuropoda melanoleuca papillomavirus 1 TaxID=2016454 RepID=A0A220IGE5_9PAPI|nr:E2 [Ailuropoda melanoleuca papillomavirus 1]ASH99054.1 E2 [Ailuropoda melanoleuca papillomavirus 1]